MMQVNRRRFIKIAACSVAAMATPFPVSALLAENKNPQLFSWKGMALGAEASLQIYHHDKTEAHKLVRACFSEIQRLENIFSLYQSNSALSQLNEKNSLDNAPPELIELIAEAINYSNLTEGAFDITVQPLWRLYSDHFSVNYSDSKVLKKEKVDQALSLVDYKKIRINKDSITFATQGMAITLNGIAQGYITDKITELLMVNGLNNILVEMGEMRAIGAHPDNRPWHVGIRAPGYSQEIIDTVTLKNSALATSGGYGTKLGSSGEYHHLFNPQTGDSANRYQSVSVIAPTATQADALSTAFILLEEKEINNIVLSQENISAYILANDGKMVHFYS